VFIVKIGARNNSLNDGFFCIDFIVWSTNDLIHSRKFCNEWQDRA